MKEYLAQRFNQGFFEGEALWIGNLGHFFIVLSFIMVALASFSFFKAELSKDLGLKKDWNKIARWSFFIHGVSIFSIFSLLFYMILNHHYEYHYAWSHSSNDLPVYYIISSFWEGQEGSFLLWMVWHVVIGNILIFTARSWESPVLTIMGIAQDDFVQLLRDFRYEDISVEYVTTPEYGYAGQIFAAGRAPSRPFA